MTNPTKLAHDADTNDARGTERLRWNDGVIGTGLVDRSARC
jgi:hypothetical protein